MDNQNDCEQNGEGTDVIPYSMNIKKEQSSKMYGEIVLF